MAGGGLGRLRISELRLVGRVAPVRLLSLFTPASLICAIVNIRTGKVRQHRKPMLYQIWGALVAAGLSTPLPNRILFAVVTGG